MAAKWYVIRSKTHKEKFLAKQLGLSNIEFYYPQIRANPVNPRARKIKPFFPGYLFVKADLEDMSINTFEWMPGAIGIVKFDGQAASVPDTVIQTIMLQVDQIDKNVINSKNRFKKGDVILITKGPFLGYEAVFDINLPGKERVQILLKMINDQFLPLELPGEQIEKKNK